MHYKMDSTRLTLREYFDTAPRSLLPILWILKLLRIRLPIAGAASEWRTYEFLEPSDLPEEVRAKVSVLEQQLQERAFVEPVCSGGTDRYTAGRSYSILLRHRSGTAVAQIHYHESGSTEPPDESLGVLLITPYDDGTFLVTTNMPPTFATPSAYRVQRVVGAAASELWRLHTQRQSMEVDRRFARTIQEVHSQEEMLARFDQYHAAFQQHLLKHGVLVPCTEAEEQAIRTAPVLTPARHDGNFLRAFPKIDQLARRTYSWGGALLNLLAALVLMILRFAPTPCWKPVAIVIAALVLHELGHVVAMRLFGYCNARAFFLPWISATVRGQCYNVPGWKKALTSLLGPLPGIGLGIAMGLVAHRFGSATGMYAGFVLTSVNAVNLLPFTTVDGGQLIRQLLLFRHPILDVACQALILVSLSLLCGGPARVTWIAFFLAWILFQSPKIYRLGKVVRRLRECGIDAVSCDGRTLPAQKVREIYEILCELLPANTRMKRLARWTWEAFEAINTAPPARSVALILLVLYVASLVTGIVAVGVLGMQLRAMALGGN